MTRVRLTGQLVCANRTEADVVVARLQEHPTLTSAEAGCLASDVVAAADPSAWQVDEHVESQAASAAHQVRVAGSAWGRATVGIQRRCTVHGMGEE